MATIYIDLDGANAKGAGTVHDGLKEDATADTGTDATHLYVAQGALDNDGDDEYNGDYLYNVTRGAGAAITDYDGDDGGGNSVITHGNIANQVATDTVYILRAYNTIEEYTTTSARSAGDIAYVRANTDEIPGADIICDEDGWNSALIYIIGCDSVTNDPWSDGSDVKPIIDNNSGSYGLRFEADKYWQVERLSFKNSSSSSGAVFVERNVYTLLKDCDFIDNSRGVVISRRSTIHAVGCLFEDNTTAGVQSEGGKGLFETCTFDAGAGGQTYGVSASYGIDAEFIDCSFGQSNAHGTNDIYIVYIGIVTLRNCAHNASFNVGEGAVICSEDDDGTYAAGQITTRAGTITKDTGIKTGSADFSLKFEPNGNCKAYSPLSPHGGTSDLSKMKSPFVVEGTASTAITCTIPIRSLGTWGTYPINTELYIEASYYDSGADAGRSTIASTQVLSHASNWVNFTVTCTPLRDGPIYIQVYLKLYEDAGDGCYVNGEVTTS